MPEQKEILNVNPFFNFNYINFQIYYLLVNNQLSVFAKLKQGKINVSTGLIFGLD